MGFGYGKPSSGEIRRALRVFQKIEGSKYLRANCERCKDAMRVGLESAVSFLRTGRKLLCDKCNQDVEKIEPGRGCGLTPRQKAALPKTSS